MPPGRRAEYGGVGWSGGSWLDYDREYCVDLVQLAAFLHTTRPEVAESLALAEDDPVRRRFPARLQGEITKRGTIDVLRYGIRHGAHDLALRQYAQVRSTVGHAERSGDLRRFIEQSKKIIISTVLKFPFILDEIGNEQRGRCFAIIIDEAPFEPGRAHRYGDVAGPVRSGSRGPGRDLRGPGNRAMESRKLLPNASCFAFTATPKNRTLQIFGDPDP